METCKRGRGWGMKRTQEKRGKWLHLGPLILGVYAMLLGFSLMLLGLEGVGEGKGLNTIGWIRSLCGFFMACLGIYGIWDGIGDLVKSKKRTEVKPKSQYILTDVKGKRSSNVNGAVLGTQLDLLTKGGEKAGFTLQVLPPRFVEEAGRLHQISCVYRGNFLLLAFFQSEKKEDRILETCVDRALALELLEGFLEEKLDFSQWNRANVAVCEEPFSRKGEQGESSQRLILFGECWKDEHKFFSVRDLELAVEGLEDGTYRKMELNLGEAVFLVFPNKEEKPNIILQMRVWEKGRCRTFQKTGTANQVKFWLEQMVNKGRPEQVMNWQDMGGA